MNTVQFASKFLENADSKAKGKAYTLADSVKAEKIEPPVTVMPWHHPNPFVSLKMQDKAAYKEHLLDHLAALDIESPTSPVLLSKIICTIGKSTCNSPTIEKMIKNGMSVARIDMSHGSLLDNIDLLRETRTFIIEYCSKNKIVYPIAIAVDIKGPEILTGVLYKAEKVTLVEGDTITLTTHPSWEERGSQAKIFVDYKDLAQIVQPLDVILLDYGRVKLSVRGTVDSDIVCDIVAGGEIHSYSDVMVLDVPLSMPFLTQKDKKDLEALVGESVDVVFISGAIGKNSVELVREFLRQDNMKGECIMIVSKIESKLALSRYDEILAASDGIIINRGKLGIELSTEKVMQAQKAMIAKATKAGKPIFSVCEYLNSMIHKNCPTFAEAADVVATIHDGVDGIILKDETAIGEYPDVVVRTLNTLCKEAESLIWQQEVWSSLNMAATPPVDPSHAIAIAAVEASMKSHAAAIVVVTTSGTSAKLIARYRPRCPVLAVSRYGAVVRQMNLYKCIVPVHYVAGPHKNWHVDVDLRLQYAINLGKIEKYIKPGDPLILVSGWRQGAGFTNNIRVVYASADEPWVLPFSPVVIA
ncbi:pyruvate kinase-like [Cimex lectularius]|uniref:Pyruvate kinase n=1 Tax=Cimex lectularius TaxID=79782 RepID=A0A8I6RXZ2_CIMLE|nr:pyruvate kinase-like [Cimex lectularius]